MLCSITLRLTYGTSPMVASNVCVVPCGATIPFAYYPCVYNPRYPTVPQVASAFREERALAMRKQAILGRGLVCKNVHECAHAREFPRTHALIAQQFVCDCDLARLGVVDVVGRQCCVHCLCTGNSLGAACRSEHFYFLHLFVVCAALVRVFAFPSEPKRTTTGRVSNVNNTCKNIINLCSLLSCLAVKTALN